MALANLAIHAKMGRPRNLAKLLDKANLRLEQALPDVFKALINKALEVIPITCPKCGFQHEIVGCGDKEVAMYLIDRRLGKPRIQVDSNVMQATVNMTPADYAKRSEALRQFMLEQSSGNLELPENKEVAKRVVVAEVDNSGNQSISDSVMVSEKVEQNDIQCDDYVI